MRYQTLRDQTAIQSAEAENKLEVPRIDSRVLERGRRAEVA
jgi:hypothetical protein